MAIDPNEIELTPEMKQAIAAKAAETGKAWTEVVSEALSNLVPSPRNFRQVGEGRSFYDAMVEDGAIGAVTEGLPSDIASNPAHLEGFGRD